MPRKKRVNIKKPKADAKPAELTPLQRNVAMFKDWLTGMPYQALADKYSMSYDNVYHISVQYKWKDLKAEALNRAFASAVSEVKSMALSMTLALKRDMELIIANAIKDARTLTAEERAHFRVMLDRFFKEARLDEGKPTEISSGTHRIELALPPGVKRFGIIPPDPRVTLVETETAKPDEAIDLDAVDYNPKDIK